MSNPIRFPLKSQQRVFDPFKGQWHFQLKGSPAIRQRGDYSGGPVPDFHGIPYSGCPDNNIGHPCSFEHLNTIFNPINHH